MRGACIDIGSNTTRLLVADCDGQHLREIHQARAFTRIGYDMAADGRIGGPKVAEVGEVVAVQLDRARELGADRVRCVATAALRRALNAREAVTWLERRCPGLTVEVLSEEEEARLAFLGASLTLPQPPNGPLGLVDVGGGSSEMVVGEVGRGVAWWVSVPLGSGDLTARFVRADPPAAAELARARGEVQAVLGEIEPPRPALALAVGGSATALVSLAGGVLDPPALEQALELLTRSSVAEVAADTGLDAERVRLLPAGLLILLEASLRLDRPLMIGSGGLREGVLLAAARG